MTHKNLLDALTNKYAWLVIEMSWNRLHYIPGITLYDWQEWWDPNSGAPNYEENTVKAICGMEMKVTLPGIFARMGLTRCAHCCDKLGIPRGYGAPQNDKGLDDLREDFKTEAKQKTS